MFLLFREVTAFDSPSQFVLDLEWRFAFWVRAGGEAGG